MMNSKDPQAYIEENLTDEDIEAWHNGELTAHVEQLMREAGVDELQIYGSHTGSEPLSIIVH
jgi:hypothetical protein